MKIKLLYKGLILFGLFLFFSTLVPFLPDKTVTALADTGKEKQLNVSSVILAKGKTFSLRTYNVGDAKISFKSGDEEVASVNDDGVIYAKQVGETDITVIIKSGSDSPSSLSCHVLVGPAAVSVKLTQSIVILSVDSTETLNVILKPSNTVENAKFSSVTPDVVSVTPGGRATAKAYGFAELRAYIDDTGSDGSQKYDSCGVIVTSEENVSKLEDYFSEHTELDQISEEDLFVALTKFFNNEPDQASSSKLVDSLDRYLNKEFNLN